MGRRSATESIASIYRAFLRERTWTQAALAREVGITAPALRKRLDELQTLGMPLDREEDPPQIFWSVPKTWFPGGVLFPDEQLPDLLHVLWHASRTRRRALLLRVVLGSARDRPDLAAADAAIIPHAASEAEETFLPVIEDAVAKRLPVRMNFYSSERDAIEVRHISVHRVDVGPSARFIATCHRSGGLKWFRVDNVMDASGDGGVPYRGASDVDVERFRAESIDGFREADGVEKHAFVVREPEARWVEKNLLPPMSVEKIDGGGIRVTAETAGALRVARFVVGLGGAARVETVKLRAIAERLARGSLEAGDAGRPGEERGAELNVRADERIDKCGLA